MDKQFLEHYNRELQHLREMSGEFARDFPKIAARLSLDEFGCADPYVERLLEGFAYLTARVQRKIDGEFPSFTQALMNTVYPHYFAPVPSMVVAEFEPDLASGDLAAGRKIPRGTALRSLVGAGNSTPCQFRTGHDVTLWPLRLTAADYHIRDLEMLSLPASLAAKAAVRLRFEVGADLSASDLAVDRLTLFLRGTDAELPVRLYEQCFAHCTGVIIQDVSGQHRNQVVASSSSVRQVGFDEQDALLPGGARTFYGYRLLREYLAFPQRFMFVELTGLAAGFSKCQDSCVDVLLTFDEVDYGLEQNVGPRNFALYCTPAVNLFAKRADPVHIAPGQPDFHVVADRRRPLDYEIVHINDVRGFGSDANYSARFLPFYSLAGKDSSGVGAYYSVRRVERALTEHERRSGPRSSYLGEEVYLSIVDPEQAPYAAELSELSVQALCSNRDLPLHMSLGQGGTDFTISSQAPLNAIHCLAGPTRPVRCSAEASSNWRVISHLSLNYLSLTDTETGAAAAVLREILSLYCDPAAAQLRKQIQGVREVSAKPVIQRLERRTPPAFVRGLEVSVELNEDAFRGSGVFLLGAVLDRFFGGYVSLNSFTRTVVRSTDRGEVMRWPPRSGMRPLI